MKTHSMLAVLTASMMLFMPCVSGCGKKDKPAVKIVNAAAQSSPEAAGMASSDTTEILRKEAAGLSVDELEKRAQDYARQIESQRTVMLSLAAEIKTTAGTPQGLAKASEDKDKLIAGAKKMTELSRAYAIYSKLYESKGGNLDKIKITPVEDKKSEVGA